MRKLDPGEPDVTTVSDCIFIQGKFNSTETTRLPVKLMSEATNTIYLSDVFYLM